MWNNRKKLRFFRLGWQSAPCDVKCLWFANQSKQIIFICELTENNTKAKNDKKYWASDAVKVFSHEVAEANPLRWPHRKKEKKYGFGEFTVQSSGRLCFIRKWKLDAATKRILIKLTAEKVRLCVLIGCACVCVVTKTIFMRLSWKCVESLLINVDRRFALITQSVSIDTIFHQMRRNLYTFFFFCFKHCIAYVSCIATGYCALHQRMRRNDDKKRREIVYGAQDTTVHNGD